MQRLKGNKVRKGGEEDVGGVGDVLLKQKAEKKKSFAEGNGLMHWSMLLKKEFKNERLIILPLHKSVSIIAYCESGSILPLQLCCLCGIILLWHNSWPKYRILSEDSQATFNFLLCALPVQ